MTSFKEWLNISEDVNESFDINEADTTKIKGSLNKLIEIMKGKDDSDSKEILKQAKGILADLKKEGGISTPQAKWLYDTWQAFKGQ